MDKEALELGFEQEGSQMALMLSIPVLRAREEAEIEATLAEEDAKKAEEETEENENKSDEKSTNSEEENCSEEKNSTKEENETSDEPEPEIVESKDENNES